MAKDTEPAPWSGKDHLNGRTADTIREEMLREHGVDWSVPSVEATHRRTESLASLTEQFDTHVTGEFGPLTQDPEWVAMGEDGVVRPVGEAELFVLSQVPSTEEYMARDAQEQAALEAFVVEGEPPLSMDELRALGYTEEDIAGIEAEQAADDLDVADLSAQASQVLADMDLGADIPRDHEPTEREIQARIEAMSEYGVGAETRAAARWGTSAPAPVVDRSREGSMKRHPTFGSKVQGQVQAALHPTGNNPRRVH